MEEVIQEGSRVLLLTERRKRYLVKVKPGVRFHTSEGYVDLSNLVGKRYGTRLTSNTGSVWFALKPTILDIVMKMPRPTQIVYPKDLGTVIFFGNIRPGSRVVEAGTGSGVLTAVMASYVMPYGVVYSYDVLEEHLENARKQLDELGLLPYVRLKQGDVTVAIEERDLDTVVLDIPTPWLAVPNAYKALSNGGVLVSLSPTIDQVMETVEALNSSGFVDITTIELLMRTLRVKRGMTRPDHMMRAHTTYITIAKKAYQDGQT
ncbi:MAG: tRNA (adenine-N1)-methyltransferase [Nitrososphaerota archaeon]